MSYSEFKADEWATLTMTERASRCQFLNNEALALAENAKPNEAHAYRALARAWMILGDAIASASCTD